MFTVPPDELLQPDQNESESQRLLKNIQTYEAVEPKLRESERRFRTAFAEAAVGLSLTDIDGRFIEVNEAYCKITGYTAADLYSHDFQSITHRKSVV